MPPTVAVIISPTMALVTWCSLTLSCVFPMQLRRKQFCQLGLVLRDLSAEVECPPEDAGDAQDATESMDVE